MDDLLIWFGIFLIALGLGTLVDFIKEAIKWTLKKLF